MQVLLEAALGNAVIAGVLACIVFGVTRVWKNHRAAHALWIIVLLKLVTPPLWSAPVPSWMSLSFPASDSAANDVSPQRGDPNEPALATHNENEIAARPFDEPRQNSGEASPMLSHVSGNDVSSRDAPATSGVAIGTETGSLGDVAGDAEFASVASFPFAIVLLGIWATGSLIWLSVVLCRVLRFHRLVRRLDMPPETLIKTVQELASRIGLNSPPAVRLVKAPIAPMVWPVGRSMTILLPSRLYAELSDEQSKTVLMHELVHIRRKDHWVRYLQVLVGAVYWWHPAVWLSKREILAAEEECCDAEVLQLVPEQRLQYGESLLWTVEFMAGEPGPILLSSVFGKSPSLKRRLEMILENRFRKPLSNSLKLGLLAFAIAVLPLTAWTVSAEERDEPVAKSVVQSSASSTKDSGTTTNTPAARRDKKTKPKKTAAKKPRKDYRFPITVSGRALDSKGNPIVGAKIYIASQRVEWKRLAETKTDQNGRYLFEEVELPIQPATNNADVDSGRFEVFGQAVGYGFAWRPRKLFSPKNNPWKNVNWAKGHDLPVGFSVDEKIVLDLRFPPPVKLGGRLVDDSGKPVVGADVAIRHCDPIPAAGYRTNQQLLTFSKLQNLESLNNRSIVPADMKIRKTDATGRFEFTSLPPNCRMRVYIRAKGLLRRFIFVATRKGAKKFRGGTSLYTDGMQLTLATPRYVPLRVVYGDTGKPAPLVLVSGGSSKTSNDDGRVTLALPRGRCRMELLPQRGTPYLVTGHTIEVGDKPPRAPVVVHLKPAAVVEVTVLDADTGRGLSGVDLWRERMIPGPGGRPFLHRDLHYFRSWEKKTRIAHVERPRTNAAGKLRALFEPGSHHIGVALHAFPRWYVVVENNGVKIDCKPGKPTRVTLHMRNTKKKAKPEKRVARKTKRPWIVVAKHVVLFEGEIIAWKDVRTRLNALDKDFRVRPSVYFTMSVHNSARRIARLKDLFAWGFQAGVRVVSRQVPTRNTIW